MQVTNTPEDSKKLRKPEDPQSEPHAGIKMAQILGLPCIFVVSIHIHIHHKQTQSNDHFDVASMLTPRVWDW